MKTDKFENTIRRKLESITPEFHENDWTKMQNFMHVNTPPTFWQQYSSWFGYAAAAAVTSITLFLYVNQLSQNNNLLSDVKTLQYQIETIKNTPAVIQKTDTVYIVQRQEVEKPSYDDQTINQEKQRFISQQNKNPESSLNAEENLEIKEENNVNSLKPHDGIIKKDAANSSLNNKNEVLADRSDVRFSSEKPSDNAVNENTSDSNKQNYSVAANSKPGTANSNNYFAINEANNPVSAHSDLTGNSGNGNTIANNTAGYQENTAAISTKTLDKKFDQLEALSPVGQINHSTVSHKMNYGLVHRISPKQIKNVLLAANTPKIQEDAKNEETIKKIESTKKAETAIPKFNLKVPYRFGIAQQWEGKNQVRTILGEVLITKNISISTGLSWVKIKSENFFSEKNYNEKNRTDFKKDHFLPMALKISNMNIKSSLLQIPLNVSFRKDITNGFAYFVGAGTNFTLNSKRNITYECFFNFIPRPGPDIFRTIQKTSEKMDLQLVNSMNFSAGLEKSWHPFVIQAEGYLYNYFAPLSPQASKTGPGFKIKLLYQIGKKM